MLRQILLFVSILFSLNLSAQAPFLLKDIMPGTAGSNISEVVSTKSGHTFFNADDNDADLDPGLWRTDGTPGGTIKLNLLSSNFSSSKATLLTPVGNNKIVFAGDNGEGYGEIWASDGTQAGTIALERFEPPSSSTPVQAIFSMGDFVLYAVLNNAGRLQLRRTNGTVQGTQLLHDFGSTGVNLYTFTELNGVCYFNFYDLDNSGFAKDIIWRSDGTQQGTYELKDLGDYPVGHGLVGSFMVAGNNFYFMAVDYATNGAVLFKSNGTAAGTAPLKKVSGNYVGNTQPPFAAINSTLYFAANDGVNGKELWKTDGTAEGTVMVEDINSGAGSSNPTAFTVIDSILYFSANIDLNGDGKSDEGVLYKFDGSEPDLVKQTFNDSRSSAAIITSVENRLYLSAADFEHGVELWTSNGTSDSTNRVIDINPGVGSSNPVFRSKFDRFPAYFIATSASTGRELYKLDNPLAPTKFTVKGGNWSDPATWNNNKMPDATSDIILNHHMTVDTNAECKSLTTSGYNVIIHPGVQFTIRN